MQEGKLAPSEARLADLWQRMVTAVGIHTVNVLMERAIYQASQKHPELALIERTEQGLSLRCPGGGLCGPPGTGRRRCLQRPDLRAAPDPGPAPVDERSAADRRGSDAGRGGGLARHHLHQGDGADAGRIPVDGQPPIAQPPHLGARLRPANTAPDGQGQPTQGPGESPAGDRRADQTGQRPG